MEQRMSLVDVVRSASGMAIEDEDGEVGSLVLSPGLSPAEVESLARSLPCPIPPDVLELLAFSRGFENGPLESVCFAGLQGGFGMNEAFPHPLPIAHDGFGNYWIVDLLPRSVAWGPIFYACHDPAVVVFQCATLEQFINEVLRFANPPHESALNDIHEDGASRIWQTNAGATPVGELRDSPDAAVREFCVSLSDAYFVVDLRSASPGDGFSWGRFGPRTRVHRFKDERLFAYESKSMWQRLLGR
jgi:hypothetical protein